MLWDKFEIIFNGILLITKTWLKSIPSRAVWDLNIFWSIPSRVARNGTGFIKNKTDEFGKEIEIIFS